MAVFIQSGKPRARPKAAKQNLTVSLAHETIRQAKILAARQSTSISGLVQAMIEERVDKENSYAVAHRNAIALMQSGLQMGGKYTATREELHDRENLR